MFDVGGGELILIILAIIVLFGPKKLPEIARNLGKGFQKFKQAQDDIKSQFSDVTEDIRNPVSEVKKSVDKSVKETKKNIESGNK